MKKSSLWTEMLRKEPRSLGKGFPLKWFTASSSSTQLSGLPLSRFLPFHQVLHSCFSIHLNMPHILNSCLHERSRWCGSIRDNRTWGQQKNNWQYPLQDENSSTKQLAFNMHLSPTLLHPAVKQAKNYRIRLIHYSCSFNSSHLVMT